MRRRKNLIEEMSATHIRMMHKALEQMNIKFQQSRIGMIYLAALCNLKRVLSGPTVSVK